jgi:serine protease AprX
MLKKDILWRGNWFHTNLKLTILFVILGAMANAQAPAFQIEHHFFIAFKDKGLNYLKANKDYRILSDRALERRKKYGIPLDDYDDPVSNTYIENITREGIQVRYATKWLNGVVVTVKDPEKANRLKLKFFVESVQPLGKTKRYNLDESISKSNTSMLGKTPVDEESPVMTDKTKYATTYDQLQLSRIVDLHHSGLEGQGVYIAVLDAGFKNANRIQAFQHLFEEDKVKFAYDVADLETNVYDDDQHGLHVLSCMAAYTPSLAIGSAPFADYALFRTEAASYELPLEEFNWIRAAEIADSLGVDLLTSSLGYNKFDTEAVSYTQEDLNGRTSYVSRGASIAASRGIMILNSAGNDGNKSWKKINFPADGNHVFVVGAVKSTGERADFSAYGPTIDGRIKPDVSAMGYQTSVVNSYGGVSKSNGTSFSTPIVAGAVALLMQAFPSTPLDSIALAVRLSANQSNNPDTLLGYGIPNFYLAYRFLSGEKEATPVLDEIPSEIDLKTRLVYFNPSSEMLSAELGRRKRFLFFKWVKTISSVSVERNPFGYTVTPLPIDKRIGNNKTYTLVIYSSEGESQKKILEKDVLVKK